MDELVNALKPHEARVNVTWQGQNGDLPDPVAYDSTEKDIRTWITEAVRTGGVPGIRADEAADFKDFMVERFNATEARPFNLIQIRPKTPFGCDHGKAWGLCKRTSCEQEWKSFVAQQTHNR
jgi:hypothetical protein